MAVITIPARLFEGQETVMESPRQGKVQQAPVQQKSPRWREGFLLAAVRGADWMA
jgi:hypothetical protein